MSVAWISNLFKKKVDFLNLCKNKVRSIENLVNGGNLLNQRQCKDLSIKLSQTLHNIQELLSHSVAPADLFRPTLDETLANLYRYLEKAIQLVKNCVEADWCSAAIFQCQNENAFREILLDVGLCYNAIYEQIKSTSEESNVRLQDLWESPVFIPTTETDILEDQQVLQKMLENPINNRPSSDKQLGHSLAEEEARKQSLATYLLLKMHYNSKKSHATALDTSSEILWQKKSEPPGTWGNSYYLGGGATEGGVCRTAWLGIPCAKKEFHVKELRVYS